MNDRAKQLQRPKNSTRRLAVILVATPVVGFMLVVLVLWWIGDGLFYRPDSHVRSEPGDHGPNVEVVSFSAPGGPELHAWWLPAHGTARGTVVYCHGNAGNLTGHVHNVVWLPPHGYSVLVFDYRGYGNSRGRPTRAGTVADAVAAIDFALARDPERTVVFGHSLGGAIGIAAAAQRPAVRAVIAESTFPNYRAIARATSPILKSLVPMVVSSGFDPDSVLDRITPRPLLVIHGTDDHIVPVELGRQLHAAAHEPKDLWIVPGARHATPWEQVPREFEQRVTSFFAEAIGN